MKKYVKPELIFESFEMSQQIATCDYDSNNSFDNVQDCNFTGYNKDFDGDINIFSSHLTCGVEAQWYCYHNSSGGYGIFNS